MLDLAYMHDATDTLREILDFDGLEREADWCWHTGHYTIIVPCTEGGTL